MKPFYTQDEANEILRRAVERLPLRDEMSRVQLESIATELGVSPQSLRKAEEDWLAERSEQADRIAFAATKRLSFYKHLVAYILVVIMIAFVTQSEHDPEGMIPTVVIALVWGIGIASHALSAFNTTGDHFQSAYTQWRIERRARELAEREFGRIPPSTGA